MSSDKDFTIDAQACAIEAMSGIICQALAYLMQPDVGYGLSPVGVQNVIDILRGEWERTS